MSVKSTVARTRSGPSIGARPRQEFLDLVGERVDITGPRDMIGAGQFDVFRTGDRSAEEPARLDVDARVVRAMQDERRHADRVEDVAHVDLAILAHERGNVRRARTEPLEA